MPVNFSFSLAKKDIVGFPKGLQNPTIGFLTPNTVAYRTILFAYSQYNFPNSKIDASTAIKFIERKCAI